MNCTEIAKQLQLQLVVELQLGRREDSTEDNIDQEVEEEDG